MKWNETRVFPSSHDFIRRALHDFRIQENGKNWVARLKGEGRFRSSVFPELADKEQNILVELIPEEEWRRPSRFYRWFAAFRLPYVLFSLLPLLLVLSVYVEGNQDPNWTNTFLLFASVILIHLSCNLWSDFEDHIRGIDSPEHGGGSGVIQKLWIPAVHIRNAAAGMMLIGIALGAALLFQLPIDTVGKHLFWLGAIGAFGAASYSGWPFHYKYFGLGEPIVFFLSGPLVTIGAALVLFQELHQFLWFAIVSLPLAFLVILRLHAGNMQRIPFDSMASTFTIARWLGFSWSKLAFLFLATAPFLLVGAYFILGIVGLASLSVFLAVPLLWLCHLPLRKSRGPLDSYCSDLRRNAARLHIFFGLIYSLSFLIS